MKVDPFWSAVAERSGDTAFRLLTELPKRRGASLPAAVQIFYHGPLHLCVSALSLPDLRLVAGFGFNAGLFFQLRDALEQDIALRCPRSRSSGRN